MTRHSAASGILDHQDKPNASVHFSELLAQFERGSKYLCARHRLTAHEAEDLRQEALLIFLREMPNIDYPLPWLLATFRLILLNRARSWWPRKVACVDPESLALLAGAAPDSRQKDLRLDLAHLARRLPPRQLRLLQQYLLGLTEQELAQQLGRRHTNSLRKDRLRAIRRLRALVEPSDSV
jgi:DNA-directed RNA polymerase specialized sigma24 family protein